MGRTIDPPSDDPGGDPGTPGYTPPTGSNTRIAFVTTATNCTITQDMITAAGGPWPAFTLKVTPVNDWGAGTPGEADYPA